MEGHRKNFLKDTSVYGLFRWWVLLGSAVAFVLTSSTRGETHQERGINAWASVSTSGPTVTLHWPARNSGVTYSIYRKSPGANTWGGLLATVDAGTATTWSHSGTTLTNAPVTPGTVYEYQIVASGQDATGAALPLGEECYVSVSVERPPQHSRGLVALFYEAALGNSIPLDLATLRNDLVGDGWRVFPYAVPVDPVSGAKILPAEMKAITKAIYASGQIGNTSILNTLYLLGNLPIAYSGVDDPPDGHPKFDASANPDCVGARLPWPAETYFADLDGNWTDQLTIQTKIWTNSTGKPIDQCNPSPGDVLVTYNWNVPGDGYFDQHYMPTKAELGVGRVTMTGLPQYGGFKGYTETQLLSRYLAKAHNFKWGRLVGMGGVVTDMLAPPETFLEPTSGWQNLSAMLGAGNVKAVQSSSGNAWAKSLSAGQPVLWASGYGFDVSGTCQGVVSPADFASSSPPRVIFSTIFGSFFGNWDGDPMMRSALAAANYGLSCSWSGRPFHHYHWMAIGETLGYCIRMSANLGSDLISLDPGSTDGQYFSLPSETNIGKGVTGAWMALMGDPTLRLNAAKPPGTVESLDVNGAMVWRPSPEHSFNPNFLGYYVYSAPTVDGPFTCLNPGSPITSSFKSRGSVPQLVSSSGVNLSLIPENRIFMVRSAVRETWGGGTYHNLSQGVVRVAAGNATVPTIVNQPGPATLLVNPGQPAAFAIQAYGADASGANAIAYRWRKSGIALSDGANLLGTTGNAILIRNAQPCDSGPYDVVVTNSAGSVTSTTVNLIVRGVSGRWAFYNGSSWTGNQSSASSVDDQGIAVDKIPLLPGGKASFVNYTSYSKGINGIIVDLPPNSTTNISASDFKFVVGNSNAPATWALAPSPLSITTIKGAGTCGFNRVTLIWGDSVITNNWLGIKILNTVNTGLPVVDYFYFGNAIGDTGNSAIDAIVNNADSDAITAHFGGNAGIDSLYDVNRDRVVDATDAAIASGHQTTSITALQLINLAGAARW